jgi:hypothetical protein
VVLFKRGRTKEGGGISALGNLEGSDRVGTDSDGDPFGVVGSSVSPSVVFRSRGLSGVDITGSSGVGM